MTSTRLHPALSLLVDGRQSPTALAVCTGVRRLLAGHGFASITEFTLASGRRADILALIINELATLFGGRMDLVAAFKVAAYSSTPAWLAGVFWIIPVFASLSIVGLYSLYLLYLGLPPLMRVPEGRSMAYTAVVAGAAGALAFMISGILGLVVGAGLSV